MTRPADTKLTPEVARELCQRAGSKAYLAGSIASLGSEYVLGLKAVNCQSGDTLAEEQVTAASKEKVLDALGEAASKLRGELGESLATVQKFDVPLEQATTSSLEALKAYSLGRKAYRTRKAPPQPCLTINVPSSLIRILPWATGGGRRLLQSRRARAGQRVLHQGIPVAGTCQRTGKAGDHRRLLFDVTGELDKAAQTYQEEIESYPREPRAYNNLGGVYAEQGQYEKATEITRQTLRLTPDRVVGYRISPATPLPCSASMKRSRLSTRRRRENWMIWTPRYSLRSCLSPGGLLRDGGTAKVVCR